MTRTRTPRQTVVVGAGIAGLVAAIRSAGLGSAVTLLEQAAHPGGRARTQRREGFSLNLGPHALYERGHLMGVLRWLKLPAPGTKPPQSGWLERGGALHALPGDARTFFGTTALTGAADRFGLIRRLTGAALPVLSLSVTVQKMASPLACWFLFRVLAVWPEITVPFLVQV